MATDKEYKAVIDALSGECERLHKENEELKALSQEPTKRELERDYLLHSFVEALKVLQAENDDLKEKLKQEPCEDAISREDRIKDLIGAIENDDCNYWTPTKIASALKQLPPVTPSRRKGRWIIYNYPGHECVYCSSCKEEYYEDDLYMGDSDFPRYCPNCGAKMESEE